MRWQDYKDLELYVRETMEKQLRMDLQKMKDEARANEKHWDGELTPAQKKAQERERALAAQHLEASEDDHAFDQWMKVHGTDEHFNMLLSDFFDRLDTNKNGSVDKEEVKKGIKASAKRNKAVTAFMKELDQDGNLVISKPEWLKIYNQKRKDGMEPEAILSDLDTVFSALVK